MNDLRQRPRCLAVALLILGLLAGCGGGGSSEVKGTVKYKGAPVKGGTLVFGPASSGEGKAVSATINADGTFEFASGEKARAGKYRVTFTPPEPVLTEEQRMNPKFIAPPPPYLGLEAKPAEVELKSGSNSLDLELVGK